MWVPPFFFLRYEAERKKIRAVFYFTALCKSIEKKKKAKRRTICKQILYYCEFLEDVFFN